MRPNAARYTSYFWKSSTFHWVEARRRRATNKSRRIGSRVGGRQGTECQSLLDEGWALRGWRRELPVLGAQVECKGYPVILFGTGSGLEL